MSLEKLRAKQKASGFMSRRDLAKNLVKHVETEIQDFCADNKLAIYEGLNYYAPKPESDNRPLDATLDVCQYLGVRPRAHGNTPSSPVAEVFPIDNGLKAPETIVALSYLTQVFDFELFGEVPILEPETFKQLSPGILNFALSRSDLNKAFNPDTVLPFEVKRNVMLRLRLANVIAGRIPITGDGGIVPILETVQQVEHQGTAGGNLPRYGMELSSAPLVLTESGFEIVIDDNTRRSSAATLGAIAEGVRQHTEFFELQIVNSIIQDILTGATPFAMSNPPTGKELMKLHLTLDDNYLLTTFVGTLEGIVEYLAIDPTYTSDTQRPATPDLRRAVIVDQMLGRETVAKRKAADVPALGADTDKKFGCWDRMKTFNFYTERRGSLNDTYREESERRQVIRMVLNYGGRLRAEADQCRLFVTMS